MPRFAISIMIVALIAAAPLMSRAVDATDALPRDPNNVYGQFDNGLKYIIRKNSNPPGKVALNLHVKTGAINETDAQNGLAHFIEHMAFNGSAHFEPGKLVPLLNHLGMTFGADTNAHTNYWETVYKLTMPDTKPETIELALTIFADYAGGLSLPDKEIDNERGVILEESRTRKSASERLRKEMMKQVFADTRLAVHDVIGDEDQIKTFPRTEFVDYWNTWYRPENMTLIVVGDINPDDVIAKAKEKLGALKEHGPSRQAQKAGIKPFDSARAIVLTDPEQVAGEVSFMAMKPARPIVTTVAQYRQEVIENISQWIVNRRYDELVAKGGAPFRDAQVDTGEFLNEAFEASGGAEGEPQDWNKMLDASIAEVNRAIDHGFQQRELDLAKASMLAGAERAVKTESSRDSTQIVNGLAGAVGRERPILSAQQRLDLTKQILDTVTPDELHKAFVENFKTKAYAYIVTLPESKEGLQRPTANDVLAAANAAWAKKTEAPAEQKLAGSILPSEPDAGKVASQETDNDLGMTNVVFANGVVMHHKFNDYKKDSVSIRMILPGGTIEEDADHRGVSDAASLMIAKPATSRFTSTQVRDLMTGKSVSLGGGIDFDMMVLSVNGSVKDVPAGMQLAHAILTDGVLETSALDEWKKGMQQALQTLPMLPEGQLRNAMAETIFGGDLRYAVLTPEQVKRQDRSTAEAWFKRIAGNAAIEVAVVGDIQRQDAIDLVARYVGSLPKRNNDFNALDSLRTLKRDSGPFGKTTKFKSITPKAIVIAGFIGCDELDRERRPLSLASRIITDRMTVRIREQERLVYGIGCNNAPAHGMPGTGMFAAQAPTDPQNADKLGSTILEMFKDFADKGPTEDELATAKKQTANKLDNDMKEPTFWLQQISELNYRHRPVSDLKELPGIYQTYTVDQVRDAFKKYYKDNSIIRIEVIPNSTPASQPVGAEK